MDIEKIIARLIEFLDSVNDFFWDTSTDAYEDVVNFVGEGIDSLLGL